MVSKKQTFLYCDAPDCTNDVFCFDPTADEQTAKEQRANYPTYGWVFRRGKDYCKECAIRLGYAKAEGGEG